ncbi:MAG TPA: mechanosensitive ion channel family protein [Mycobacterium sp.]|nr:mechanosensitive ion channel family protein [Mycobacterium sp.]
MTSTLDSAWFYWAVSVAVGLPVLLVALGELHHWLLRRNSSLARPVAITRTYLLPLTALLILMVEARDVPWHDTRVRLIATAVGLVILVIALAGLRATVFQAAPEGSWRQRVPSIFIDVVRFALIAVGLALIFSWVWGARIGGLFTALGISSIVLGLILQNSVGQIISGLLMLFEQPFRLGDWLETPTAKGRVVEVNWRAVHIETGKGLQITPNSVLAIASFTNLSRPGGTHIIALDTEFATADPPDLVCAVLVRVAQGLPYLPVDAVPTAHPTGGAGYRTSIPVRGPADESATRATYLRWLWYAARRAGLHLDDSEDEFSSPERRREALAVVAHTLKLTPDDQEALVDRVRVLRYGAGEPVQRIGSVPESMKFVIRGQVQLVHDETADDELAIRVLETGEFVGASTLTREPLVTGAVAVNEVTVLDVGRALLEELVGNKPELLREIGREIEYRRRSMRRDVTPA